MTQISFRISSISVCSGILIFTRILYWKISHLQPIHLSLALSARSGVKSHGPELWTMLLLWVPLDAPSPRLPYFCSTWLARSDGLPLSIRFKYLHLETCGLSEWPSTYSEITHGIGIQCGAPLIQFQGLIYTGRLKPSDSGSLRKISLELHSDEGLAPSFRMDSTLTHLKEEIHLNNIKIYWDYLTRVTIIRAGIDECIDHPTSGSP